jgi:hypothetical protein
LPIIEAESSITVPLNPVKNSKPSCVPQTIGYALDGVQIWNQYAPENLAETKLDNIPDGLAIGVDAGRGFFAEPMDACSGHPGPNQAYHYHKLPAFGLGFDSICFADEQPGRESGILGVAVDGFPLYGPFDANGIELTPADLDECNGMTMPDGSYRYIVTQDFPYGPGCFWGTAADGAPDGLCWFAKDWLDAMDATGQEFYRDCDSMPVAESTGTEGCLSYYSNPKLYKASFGDMSPWEEKYAETCGDKEWMKAFMAANPTILGTSSSGISKDIQDVGLYSASAIFGCVLLGVVATKIGSSWSRRDDSRDDSLESEYARLSADADVDYERL